MCVQPHSCGYTNWNNLKLFFYRKLETLLWVCHTYCQPVSAVSSWLRSSATRPALSAPQRRQRRARWWCCLLLYCAWGWPVKYRAKVAVNVYRFFLFNMSKCHCHVFCVKSYVCFRLLCPKGIKILDHPWLTTRDSNKITLFSQKQFSLCLQLWQNIFK